MITNFNTLASSILKGHLVEGFHANSIDDPGLIAHVADKIRTGTADVGSSLGNLSTGAKIGLGAAGALGAGWLAKKLLGKDKKEDEESETSLENSLSKKEIKELIMRLNDALN